jgi:hypothetical protein
MSRKRQTTVWRDEVDDEAIRIVRERWGAPSDAAAISFALRLVATADHLTLVPAENFARLLEFLAEEVEKDV